MENVGDEEAMKALADARAEFGPEFDPEDHMTLEKLPVQRSSLGPLVEAGFRVRLRNLTEDDEMDHVNTWLKLRAVLCTALQMMLNDARARNHRGQIIVSHPDLYTPMSTRWSTMSSLSMEELLNKVERAQQSDKSVDFGRLVFTLRFVDVIPSTDVTQYRY